MTDIYDRATEAEENFRVQALAEQKRRAQLNTAEEIEAQQRDCSVCEAPIPLERIQALPGVRTCVWCQQDLENKWASGKSSRLAR